MIRFFGGLQKLNKTQGGFTLLEIIIAIAISGVLGVATVGAIFQIGNINSLDNAHVIAVKQVENGLHYIIRDVQMVQHPAAGTDLAFPLTLSWKTWEDNKTIQVVYSVNPDGELIRQYSENGGAATNLRVAKFVSSDSAKTHWSYDSATRWMTVKITATGTSGPKQAEETRIISIIPRSGS
jgi:prepilin-type N-terminal cleavage/methylation domain-containing protein